MKIKSIVITLIPDQGDIKKEIISEPRILVFEDKQWKSNNNGFFQGEIRLLRAIDEARDKAGSI